MFRKILYHQKRMHRSLLQYYCGGDAKSRVYIGFVLCRGAKDVSTRKSYAVRYYYSLGREKQRLSWIFILSGCKRLRERWMQNKLEIISALLGSRNVGT